MVNHHHLVALPAIEIAILDIRQHWLGLAEYDYRAENYELSDRPNH